MGLKDFLKQQGFIQDDDDKSAKKSSNTKTDGQSGGSITPTFFPIHPAMSPSAMMPPIQESAEPSFVAPLQQQRQQRDDLDPTFVKFFEDELVKANLPGPDYFEFRQLLNKTQEKMASKGVSASEVILQTVLLSFEAQDVSPAKLIDAANQYKTVLKQKNDDFLKGASTEKNNQLQKRQAVLEDHEKSIKQIQQQIEQLELQKQQLAQSLNKEKTQLEVDKSLGQEGIEKIEKAEKLISIAHSYIQSTIDNDITKLQSI